MSTADSAALRPLPETFAATRAALHRVAEGVVAPARVAATGNEIALEATPGGFGTPPFPAGGRVRVEGADLVVELAGGGERRAALTTLPEAAAVAGLGPAGLDPAPLAVDREAGLVLGALYAFAWDVLGALRAECAGRRRSVAHPPVAGALRRRVRAGRGGSRSAGRVRRLAR